MRTLTLKLLLIALLFLVFPPGELIAQSALRRNVTLSFEQKELSKVLEELQDQTGIQFFYSINAIGATRKISGRYRGVPVRTVMKKIFEPLDIEFKEVDNQVILFLRQGASFAPPLPSTVRSQQENALTSFTLKGQVVDQHENPLPGANVLVRGTSVGTVTDEQGRFLLTLASGNGTVSASYAGYKTAELQFSRSSEQVVLRLIPTVAYMQDVVVIGYGTQKRVEMTGASSTVRAEDINDYPGSSPDAALQGRASGVLVTQQGGAPGSPVRIQVRGTGSISSGTEPLYVVDGIIIAYEVNGINDGITNNVLNMLSSINPADIESIEILKDAAATAIYGSRGANGVVLITTKSGKKGKGKTELEFSRGITSPLRTIDYATGSQWLEMVDQARTNSVGFGIAPGQERFDPMVLSSNSLPTPSGITGPQFDPLPNWTRQLAESTNTNWADQLIRNGSITDLRLSTSNGFDKGSFYLSGQYWDEEGILKGYRLQRYSFRSNLEFSPSRFFSVGSKMSFVYSTFNQAQAGTGGNGGSVGRLNQGATGGWGQVNTGALPIMPIYNDDGTYFDPLRGRNVAAGSDPANFSNRQNQNRFTGNVFLEFKPIRDLTLRGELGGDVINANGIYWVSDIIRYSRMASETGRYLLNTNATAYARYQKTFHTRHEITATAGAEVNHSQSRRQVFAFENLLGSQQEIGEISNGSTQFVTTVSGIFPDRRFLSAFGRVNYKYGDKYLLGLSFRRDGSSVFGLNNRYGNFPAVSGGWIISREAFASRSFLRHFSLLKFRSSYGQTGNANIPAFAYNNNFVTWPVYGQSSALALSVLGNPDIGWEKTRQIDMGLEWAVLKGRLRSSIGFFNRVSEDMLLSVPVAPSIGIGAGSQTVIINIGDLRNRGIEFELGGTIVDNNGRQGAFQWTSDLNLTLVRNKVLYLTPQFQVLPAPVNPVAIGIQQGVGITQVGGSLGTYYLPVYAGLDDEGFETIYEINREVLASTGKTVSTGRKIRATQLNINNNRMVLEGKTGLPTWFGGWSNSFSWRGFRLNMLLTFQGGNYIYDGLEENTTYVRTGNNVIRADVYQNSWTEQNREATYPKLTWNMRDDLMGPNGPAPQSLGSRTTRFLYRGDFARLRSVELSYNLPDPLLARMRMKGFTVFVNGLNLLTFSSYPGFDPETANVNAASQSRNLTQGFVSNAPIPQVRTVVMGIRIGF